MSGLTYPDTRDVLFELIDGQEFAGYTAQAVYQLPIDFATREGLTVLIFTTGGTEGYVDRVDRATVEVYAPAPDAVRASEEIRAAIVGEGHDLVAGYVDTIACDVTPHDIPFTADTSQARTGYLVTTRPL